MMKKIGISIGVIFLGFTVSVLAESALRQVIQTLFMRNAIYFYGKDFHLFATPFYYFSFGLGLLIIWFSWDRLTAKEKALDALLTLIIFFIAIGFISWLVSAKMVVECTACNDGTRGIHYNDINYDGIIIASVLLSMIPSGIRLLRRTKAAITQQNV